MWIKFSLVCYTTLSDSISSQIQKLATRIPPRDNKKKPIRVKAGIDQVKIEDTLYLWNKGYTLIEMEEVFLDKLLITLELCFLE